MVKKNCFIISCSWTCPILTLLRRSGERLRTFRSSSLTIWWYFVNIFFENFYLEKKTECKSLCCSNNQRTWKKRHRWWLRLKIRLLTPLDSFVRLSSRPYFSYFSYFFFIFSYFSLFFHEKVLLSLLFHSKISFPCKIKNIFLLARILYINCYVYLRGTPLNTSNFNF